MEQTLSSRSFRPSSPCKRSSDLRKRWRRTSSPVPQALLQPSPAAVETSPAVLTFPSPSLALDDPIYSISLGSVKQVHARILKAAEPRSSKSAMDFLIQVYSKFGDFRSAVAVFFIALQSDTLSWSYLIDSFNGAGERSTRELLEIFRELHRIGITLSVGIFRRALRNCAELVDFWLGSQIHAHVTKAGLANETYIRCSLLDFYARCCSSESADRLFEESSFTKDSILWNNFIVLNVERGKWIEALELFRMMQLVGLEADEVTVAKALHACGRLEAVKQGKAIHGHVIRSGSFLCALVSNSLISMYSKNSLVKLARRVFEYMGGRTLVSWNSIISCCSLNGFLEDALELFRDMVAFGAEPDLVTWNCLISGHSHHGSPHRTFELLRKMQEDGFQPNSSSITSVLRPVTHSGYAHEGLFEEALQLMEQMEEEGEQPDLTTWNGLISGYSIHGLSKQAVVLIRQLKANGVVPNVVSWTSVISGCCRNERYEDAIYFFREMLSEGVQPNSVSVACLLRACAAMALLGKGRELHCFAARRDLDDDIFVATAHIDIIYACENRWEDVEDVRDAKNVAGVQSRGGWSWIEIDQTVHVFGVEGTPPHPDTGEIYFELYRLVSEMRRRGYVPDTSCIAHHIGEEEKEKLLLSHTEKLAMAYGLICTGEGTTIRVIKNTRVCSDCHTVAKYMSQMTGREILLRAGARFHHFRDGKCSCNDFW
ncbi:hypothetical protein C4D60_Mb07t02960 [Musa balbisiana]|uniref:DYW domain-containing protein n=1 Tax=Musa balbisiana TaxID=52838 RepID=A0A4S8JDQ8_MUSBA|nr:hypothetical protein C4D60_Mb07t02960 [Musa balbisiana]